MLSKVCPRLLASSALRALAVKALAVRACLARNLCCLCAHCCCLRCCCSVLYRQWHECGCCHCPRCIPWVDIGRVQCPGDFWWPSAVCEGEAGREVCVEDFLEWLWVSFLWLLTLSMPYALEAPLPAKRPERRKGASLGPVASRLSGRAGGSQRPCDLHSHWCS